MNIYKENLSVKFNRIQKKIDLLYWAVLFAWCGGGVVATACWWAYMWYFCK